MAYIQPKSYEVSVKRGNTTTLPSIGAYISEYTEEQLIEGDHDELRQGLRFFMTYTENTDDIRTKDIIVFQGDDYSVERVTKGANQLVFDTSFKGAGTGVQQ